MAFELRRRCLPRARFTFIFVFALTLSACVSQRHQQPQQLSGISVSRPAISHWYDDSYADYYDVYGPVKSITYFSNQQVWSKWQVFFNYRGRVQEKVQIRQNKELRMQFYYRGDGQIKTIKSRLGGILYRTTQLSYNSRNELVQTEFVDHANGDSFRINHQTLPVKQGRFTAAIPVEQVDVVNYKHFDDSERLMWSSSAGFNNGVGRMFYIKILDAVFAAKIQRDQAGFARGVGGYGYRYDDNGRLEKATSYNANDFSVYHQTTYHYNDQGLLQSEEKIVTGDSLFNASEDELVRYEYRQSDDHGNWLLRRVDVQAPLPSKSFIEKRQIEYFP